MTNQLISYIQYHNIITHSNLTKHISIKNYYVMIFHDISLFYKWTWMHENLFSVQLNTEKPKIFQFFFILLKQYHHYHINYLKIYLLKIDTWF